MRKRLRHSHPQGGLHTDDLRAFERGSRVHRRKSAGLMRTSAAIRNPTHGEHNTPLELIGGSFDPVAFSVDDTQRTSVFYRGMSVETVRE